MTATARTSSPRLVTRRPPARTSPRSAPGVVEQVRAALHPRARLATFMGCLLGGFVPVASYAVVHGEFDPGRPGSIHSLVSLLLVAGGLLFSARTVYDWGKLAFRAGGKAFGFVVLMEGVMVVSDRPWLSLVALGYLVAINAVSTGCSLSLKWADRG